MVFRFSHSSKPDWLGRVRGGGKEGRRKKEGDSFINPYHIRGDIIFHHACATFIELPSNISTMIEPDSVAAAWSSHGLLYQNLWHLY